MPQTLATVIIPVTTITSFHMLMYVGAKKERMAANSSKEPPTNPHPTEQQANPTQPITFEPILNKTVPKDKPHRIYDKYITVETSDSV